MSILIFAIVVLIIAALLIWAVDMLGLPSVPLTLVKVLIIILAAVAIAQRAGIGL